MRPDDGSLYGPLVRKKRKVLTFSGTPTTDPDALGRSLARAVRAEVTEGGYLVFAVDPSRDVLDAETPKCVAVSGTEVIARADRHDDLAELVAALAVDDVSRSVCMCSGDLAIEFFDSDNALIDVVRVDLPSTVEWPRWPGQAHLVEAGRLGRWLAAHSVEPRSGQAPR